MPGLLFLLLIQNGQMILGCQNQGLILPAAQFSSALPPLRAFCTDGLLLLRRGDSRGGFQSRGGGWSPDHPAVQGTRLSLKPTATERLAKGFCVCGAFAQCLGAVPGALPPPPPAGPGSLHRITKESQSRRMETGLQTPPQHRINNNL